MLELNPDTQDGKILAWMREQPHRQWRVSDFQKWPYFIGYEAGTRISNLVRYWLVEKTGMDGRFALYRAKPEQPIIK